MTASNKAALGGTHWLSTRAEATQRGHTDKDLRKGPYRRIYHGVYLLESVPPTHELRCRAAAMVLPPNAVITGRSAATLHGIDLAGPNDPVEVLAHQMSRRSL